MSGIFITFEGTDGMGKTTVLQALLPILQQHTTWPLIETREPGGSKIAEQIRHVLLDVHNTEMDSRTEALLYAAARRQHLVEILRPALQKEQFVFSDRFVDSSIAYQGGGREIGTKAVLDINLFATEGLKPDLTFLLDGPVEIGLKRIQRYRQNQNDRLDQEDLAFHQRVRTAYLALQAAEPARVIKIDATQPTEMVVQQCLQVIINYFPRQIDRM